MPRRAVRIGEYRRTGHHAATHNKKENSMMTLLAIFGGIVVFAFLAFQIAKS